MRIIAALLFCLLFLSSCATIPSGPGKDLAARIRAHGFTTMRAVLLGDGVSPETAARVSGDSGALVLYCPSRGIGIKGARASDLSQFVKDVVASLRAMASSRDPWEVAVAERARGQMTAALAAMGVKELAMFRGKLVLSGASRTDSAFQAQIKRVFGEGVGVEYMAAVAP